MQVFPTYAYSNYLYNTYLAPKAPFCSFATRSCCPDFLMSAKDTVKILKIGTPEIITMIVLQLEQLDFTVQYCVQKMQTE